MLGTLSYRIGDATAPVGDGPRVIAHVCNDRGGWGKGFVLALSRRWSEPEAAYRAWYRERDHNDFGLGAVQLVAVEAELWVANVIGQHGTRPTKAGPPVRYEAIGDGLAALAEHALALEASVHMPRIGCGLAGGTWERVEPLIEYTLLARGVDTTVYDLPAKGAIRFYSVSDPYGEFSNFAPYEITLDGKTWPTSEHYFQANKFEDPKEREAIRRANSPDLAARMGRDRKKKLRRDWDSRRVNVMREAVRAKFTQHGDLRALLLGTGDAKLVEHTANDSYWGDGGDGKGQNMLGQILMQVRAELRD